MPADNHPIQHFLLGNRTGEDPIASKDATNATLRGLWGSCDHTDVSLALFQQQAEARVSQPTRLYYRRLPPPQGASKLFAVGGGEHGIEFSFLHTQRQRDHVN